MSASTIAKPESWFHSPEFDSEYRRRRAQQRVWFQRRVGETIADPDEFRPSVVAARNRLLDPAQDRKRRRGDLSYELPRGNDLEVFADTFAVRSERLSQAQELQRRGLSSKARRLLFCSVIGHRVNCSASEDHRFFQPYMCHGRYCDVCGPSWFRKKFSDALFALEPVVEHLLHEGQRNGRTMVVTKLDFTVLSTGEMPKPEQIREFHVELHEFWRRAERYFDISRESYGQAGCDEFGGKKTAEHPLGNTNLHRHCVYVGPLLPQRRKELSALWSIVGLRGDRRREMLQFIRRNGLRDAWRNLAPWEQRFVSIKRARSFRAALAHALKYPSKFLSASTPQRLAELEAAFHGTRRFSTGGAFYRLKFVREPGEESPIGDCPICGARLCEIVEPWVPRFVLEAEGRRNVEEVRREVARAKVFSTPGPAP